MAHSQKVNVRADAGCVNPFRELAVCPSNPHPEEQKMNSRYFFVQKSGRLDEISMILVRMKPRTESDEDCVERNAQLFAQRGRSG